MSNFYGEYNVSMDAKGRMMLPADFRKQLQESDATTFTLKCGRNNSISFYTKSQWDVIDAKLKEMNPLDPRVDDFKSLFLDGIAMVEMDSAGRILIPKQLQEYAGLSKDVVFWLKGDKVDIWDRTRKQNFLQENKIREAALASELFK